MCSLVGLALGAAGAVTNAIGAARQQTAANQAAEHNARMMEYNSHQQRQAAEHEIRQGAEQERVHRVGIDQTMGTQAARAASMGVSVSSGSPLDIMGDTAAWGEYDALAIRENAAHRAHAHQTQAYVDQTQANFARSQKGSPLGAFGGSLLGSASPLLQQYQSWNTHLRKK